MPEWLSAAGIGFVSGVLSGMFGIGGGIVTTPAIRLLLGAPALIAVGTPLPVILPGALTGAWSYHRRGDADVRVGLLAGGAGVATAVAGAWATRLVGGSAVLVGTAALIVIAAVDTVLQAVGERGRSEARDDSRPERPTPVRVAAIGALTGLYSGFFGLGGGFVLVPMLSRWTRLPIKRAIGTSLIAVSVLSVPGTLTHALLGNIDWGIAAGLAVGVVPGALAGARLTAGAKDAWVRIGFAVLLVAAAAWLVLNELAVGA